MAINGTLFGEFLSEFWAHQYNYHDPLDDWLPLENPVVASGDDPPRRSWESLNAVIAQSQPNPRLPGPFPYDQQRRKLPPSILAVPEDLAPIKIAAATLALITAIWATPAPAAAQQKRPSIAPSLIAEVVEQPPYSSEASLSAILQSWRSADRAPQQARKLPPQLLSVDDPPFGLRDYKWFDARSWLAQPPRLIAALIPDTVAADDPPFGEPRQIPQPPPAWWPPQSAPRTQPVSVDDPPRLSEAPFASIVAQWPPRAWLSQLPRFVVQEAAVAVEFVPFTRQSVWRASVDWPVAIRRLLPASLIAVQEDSPPFGLRAPVVSVPLVWSAQAGAKIAPLIGVAVAADDPPFGRRAVVWTAQAQVWPAQSAPRLVPVSGADNPPFGRRPLQPAASVQWWPAQSAPRAVIPSTDNPPLGRRTQYWPNDSVTWRTQTAPRTVFAVVETVDNPPLARPRIAEISANWQAPQVQWRHRRQAGTIGDAVVVVIGNASGAWLAPDRETWAAPNAARTWNAPTREASWRAVSGRIWKALKVEGWRS